MKPARIPVVTIILIAPLAWLFSQQERFAAGQAPLVAPVPAPYVNPYGPYGAYGPPNYYNHASTVEEGYARGMADIVRSAGAANLLNSEAAKNFEDARAKYFDNRLRGTQTYFEMKQANDDYRNEMRGQRPSSEQLFRIAKIRAPEPIKATELDPYSGEVHWPLLLLDQHYLDDRTLVDGLIRNRVTNPVGVKVEDRASLRAGLDSLATKMRENITLYDPKEYAAAKNFLQSLAAAMGAGAL